MKQIFRRFTAITIFYILFGFSMTWAAVVLFSLGFWLLALPVLFCGIVFLYMLFKGDATKELRRRLFLLSLLNEPLATSRITAEERELLIDLQQNNDL